MAVTLGTITQYTGVTPTFTHTCGAGTVMLYVLIACSKNGGGTQGTITSMTYNGVSMTQEQTFDDSSGNTTAVFGLLNPPTGVLDTILGVFSGTTAMQYEAFAVDVLGCYSEGDPTDGGSASGSNFSTSQSYGPTTSFNNSLALSIAWGLGGTLTLAGPDSAVSTITTDYTCYLTTYQTTTAGNYDIFGISQTSNTVIGAASVGIRVAGTNSLSHDATSKGTTGSSSATSLTISHTCTGTNLVLLVGVSCNAATPTGITYNGVAMTLVTSNNDTGQEEYSSLWYLVAPATGANNIVISFSGATFASAGGISFNGALQSSSVIGAFGGGTGISAGSGSSVTTSGTNEYIIDIVSTNSSSGAFPGTAGSNAAQWIVPTATRPGGMSILPAPTATSYSMLWDNNTTFSQTVVAIKPFVSTVNSGFLIFM